MSDLVTYLTLALLIGLILLLICYLDSSSPSEGFGVDNRPFEPDNMLLNRNVWDDIDYVVPVFLTPA